jgi:hypothetical protein
MAKRKKHLRGSTWNRGGKNPATRVLHIKSKVAAANMESIIRDAYKNQNIYKNEPER